MYQLQGEQRARDIMSQQIKEMGISEGFNSQRDIVFIGTATKAPYYNQLLVRIKQLKEERTLPEIKPDWETTALETVRRECADGDNQVVQEEFASGSQGTVHQTTTTPET